MSWWFLLVIFLGAALLAWVIGLVVRNHAQRHLSGVDDRPTKIPVETLLARVERERAEQTDNLRDPRRRMAMFTGLPQRWEWPVRDWDEGRPILTPPRSRPYVRPDQRIRVEEVTDQIDRINITTTSTAEIKQRLCYLVRGFE